jgi:hypothetical protein
MSHDDMNQENGTIHLPRPTVWPMVMALGISLVLTGMVTNLAVGILGAFLAVVSCVGWFLQVLPEEVHEVIAVDFEAVPISSGHLPALSVARFFPLKHSKLQLESRAA